MVLRKIHLLMAVFWGISTNFVLAQNGAPISTSDIGRSPSGIPRPRHWAVVDGFSTPCPRRQCRFDGSPAGS